MWGEAEDRAVVSSNLTDGIIGWENPSQNEMVKNTQHIKVLDAPSADKKAFL
jgi:hypothetical protein